MTLPHIERSCGVIPFRRRNGYLEFLMLHSAMVKNPEARWEFPKGSMEFGETEVEAALREFGEETSLRTITLLPDFRDEIHYQYRRGGLEIEKTVVFFVGEVPNDLVLPVDPPSFEHCFSNAEHIWSTWATESEATTRLFHPGMRTLLHRASQFIFEHDRIQRHHVAYPINYADDDY